MEFDIKGIEEKIGYEFKDKNLLVKAFTHSSYAYENGVADNELMEFFGDSILEFFVTEWLYHSEKGDEGDLTRSRAEMVAKTPLTEALSLLGLEDYILLGNGQKKSLCKDEKFYSSVFEALICAIYLDGGIEPARKFILDTLIKNYLADKKSGKMQKFDASAKSEFQEFVQKNKLGKIEYQLINKQGPDHSAEFCVSLALNGKIIARGKGNSKKTAEALAARTALKKLKANKDGITN